MVTDDKERDFNDQGALKRPGRLDFRTLNNINDVGDGYPGLQKAVRNWVKYYLSQGDLEEDIDLNNHDLKDVKAIDGNGDAVIFNDDIDMVAKSIIGTSVDINNAEMQQLSNIIGNTISETQWGYLGNSNQNLRTTDSPTFLGLNDIYFCSTQTEITDAITAIGTSGGTIILAPGTITLSSTINISITGSLIIQGQGDKTIIDCAGDRTAFNITNGDSVHLRKFQIDATDLTTSTTEVITIDTPNVNLEYVNIFGDGTNGIGVEINSTRISVRRCDISLLDIGIRFSGSSSDSYASQNIVENNAESGIKLSACDTNIVSYNHVSGSNLYGIYLTNADFNIIIGNFSFNNNGAGSSSGGGIWIDNDSDNNSIIGNICYGNDNISSGTSTGIIINNANCDDNFVSGNNTLNNEVEYTNSGTGTVDDSSDGTTNANLNRFG